MDYVDELMAALRVLRLCVTRLPAQKLDQQVERTNAVTRIREAEAALYDYRAYGHTAALHEARLAARAKKRPTHHI